eukprot:11911219-Alexandrium_andersonii.AAC.1
MRAAATMESVLRTPPRPRGYRGISKEAKGARYGKAKKGGKASAKKGGEAGTAPSPQKRGQGEATPKKKGK